MQFDGLVHDTALRVLDVEPGGSGLATTDQLEPSQCSIRVTLSDPAPTAVQSVAPVHEMADKAPLAVGSGATIDHVVPSHCSMSGNPPDPVLQTAMQSVASKQDTPDRELLFVSPAVGMSNDQLCPSHCSTMAWL